MGSALQSLVSQQSTEFSDALPRGAPPFPFLWSMRVVNEAAAALDYHQRLGTSRVAELSSRGIIPLEGEVGSSTTLLAPRARRSERCVPHRLSLATALAACLGSTDPNRRLGLIRPLLPAAIIHFVDGARARRDSSWLSERELLKAQQRRLQGPHSEASAPMPRSPRERCSSQLGLLPALFRLEGAAAVESFFADPAASGAQRVAQLRAALGLWRCERRCAISSSGTLERTGIDDQSASNARIAQARFEFEHRDPRAGLLLAIDAAQTTPDSPDAWLLLAEIRGSTCSGSRALCLSEAICAARGEATVIERVRSLLGMRDQRKLAAYFRVHGDHVLADFLEPPPRWQAPSELQH